VRLPRGLSGDECREGRRQGADQLPDVRVGRRSPRASQPGRLRALRPSPYARWAELEAKTAERRPESGLADWVDALHDCAYSGSVEIEWDAKKAASNLRKHGIDFADAALVFEDDLALTTPDLRSQHEERFVTLGCDPQGQLLVVVYTWREERLRLITAREATGKERRQYEEER
jgi:uncharacterized DUF497 family protein